MEFKTITEAIDQIAILQRKAKEFQGSEELKKDMSESLEALDRFVKEYNANLSKQDEVVTKTKNDVPITSSEFIDFMILKAFDSKIQKEKGLQPTSDIELLKMAIKDKTKLKTLATTSTMTDWIPAEFQNQVIDLIIANTSVIAEFFQNIFRWNTGSNKRDYPYVDWYASFYGVEGNTITDSTADDLKLSLVAKPFKGLYKWTDETDLFTLVEMLPILRNALYVGLAVSIEDSIINGDTTISAPSPRNHWNGLRKLALTASISSDMSTFNLTNFRALLQKLGSYGIRPNELLIVAEESRAYWAFLNDQNFLTIDKVGAKATVLTGQLGIYSGIPLRTSVAIPLTNTSGQIDATPANNTKGSFIIVNKRPFGVGFYGTPIIETDKDITLGVTYLVMRQYFAFKNAYSDKGVAVGYNI